MRQTEFYIAIIGAISRFKGFGENIASSQSFSNDIKQVRAVSEIDKEVASFYDTYPSPYLDLPQWFGFPKKIADTNCFLIIRAKKKFTAFPEQNRFYDRREYFYFNLDNDIDSIDFSASIPVMIQYETEQLGQVNNFLIQEANYRSDDKFQKYIIRSLLTQSTVIIKVTENNADETKDKILGAIQKLPVAYKKYLGFGFNVESNAVFVKNNLHLFTTLDDSGVEASALPNLKIKDNDLNDFAEALFTEQIQYDDTEILLLNIPLNRNTLYELIKFHKLHFKTDKYSQGNIPENKKDEFLSESKQYVSDFLTSSFATNRYILERIIKVYKAWDFNGLIKTDLFTWFWKKVNEVKISHEKLFADHDIKRSINETIQLEVSGINTFNEIDSKFASLLSFTSFNIANASLLDEIKIKYISSYKGNNVREVKEIEAYKQQATKNGIKADFQSNFYARVDFGSEKSNLTKSENFEILKNEIDELSENQILSLIKKIGFSELFNLLSKEKSEKILRNVNFYEPIMELLVKEDNLPEILKWISLFNENNSNASFEAGKYLNNQAEKIKSQNDYSLFDSLCRIIQENKKMVQKNEVIGFIEKVISQPNCQTIQFYKTSFEVAASFQFKIIATHPNSENENDLLDFISLYGRNSNTIKNNKIVIELTESFIKSFSQSSHGIETILNFSYTNQSFVESNKDKFQKIVEESFTKQNEGNKLSFTLSLFKHTIETSRNFFLQQENNLYNQINELEINDRNFTKEIHRLGLKIGKKNTQLNEVKKLINSLIDKYFYSIDNNVKFFTKMRNRISFINRNTKILCAVLFVALAVAIGATIYYYSQNSKLLKQAEKTTQENATLKAENQKLTEEISASEKETTNNNEVLLLSLMPNGELNDNDQKLVSRQGIQNKTVFEVVEIIFEKNNADIKTHYSEQKEAYAIALIKANPDCFKNDICICTTLKHIPSYK
jgi:cell division protein FtsB